MDDVASEAAASDTPAGITYEPFSPFDVDWDTGSHDGDGAGGGDGGREATAAGAGAGAGAASSSDAPAVQYVLSDEWRARFAESARRRKLRAMGHAVSRRADSFGAVLQRMGAVTDGGRPRTQRPNLQTLTELYTKGVAYPPSLAKSGSRSGGARAGDRATPAVIRRIAQHEASLNAKFDQISDAHEPEVWPELPLA